MAIQKQLAFFEEHKRELCAKYSNQIIVISDDLQITSFAAILEAYEFGEAHYGLGNFMLKRCVAAEEEVRVVTPQIKVLW